MEGIKPQPGAQERFLSSHADIAIYGGAAEKRPFDSRSCLSLCGTSETTISVGLSSAAQAHRLRTKARYGMRPESFTLWSAVSH